MRSKKELATLSICQPFGYIGRFVSFFVGLLGQGCDFFLGHCHVVNANIVDQAGS